MPKYDNKVGRRYGRLVVLEEAEPFINAKGGKIRKWLCRCDCGETVVVFGINLTSGHSTQCKKCGIKQSSALRKKHGACNTRLYKTWSSMKARCYCRGSSGYDRYGAVGITVCDEWLGESGFRNFSNWAIANGFIEDCEQGENTIDRIDPSKGYSPDNCRFVNNDVQSNNRKFCLMVTDIDGETLTLKQLARKHNISYGTMHSRWARGVRDVKDLLKPSGAPFVEYGKDQSL